VQVEQVGAGQPLDVPVPGVEPDRPFRHAAREGHRVGPFLDLLAAPGTEITP
jgi:hypothetical protein